MDRLGRRPDSYPSGAVSARSPFVCVDASAARSFARAKGSSAPMLGSPSARSSTFSAATTASTTFLDASADGAASDEDDALWALASAARTRLLAARGQSLDSSEWRQRRASATEMVFDRRASTSASASVRSEYNVVAKTSLPCSVAEISAVLASDRSDDLNATLVALLGDVFAFAVTLRDVPTARPHAQHLSTKLIRVRAGWGPLALPLAAAERSLEFLDFVDVDRARGRVVRVIRSLRRDASGKLTVPGDLLVGYELVEKPAAQCTRVFYFGAMLDASASSLSASAMREISSAHGLLKLAKLLPKIGAIAVRRRFGAQQACADAVADDAAAAALSDDSDADAATTSSARSLDMGADADACAACSDALCASGNALRLLAGGRKRRHACALCGLSMCGHCAPVHEVEERIGVVDKRRICGECVTTLRLDAFQRSAASAAWSPSLSSASSSASSASPVAYSRYRIDSLDAACGLPMLEDRARPVAMCSR